MNNFLTTVLAVVCLVNCIGFSQQADTHILKAEPRYIHLDYTKTPESTHTCTLQDSTGRTVPISRCEFIIDGWENTWKFNMGHDSPQSAGVKWPGRYHGRGLQYGDCGITITGFNWGFPLVLGCRVRPAEVDVWVYEKMMIYTAIYPPLQFHLQPHVTVATAGSDVTFNGVAEDTLDWCHFYLPPANDAVFLDFNDGLTSANHSLARYNGTGLENKQCGVTLLNVQPELSGFVHGRVFGGNPDRTSADFVEIVVLTAPEVPPLLTVNAAGPLSPGDVLHAICVVKNSRPVAKLTWYLGDDVIRNDTINEAPLDYKWRWNHDLQTIEQHLDHVVTVSDDGKQLKCKASHVALPGPVDSMSYVIRVLANSN